MARPRGIPTYRKHRQSGQAVVTLTDSLGNRKDVLLGKHNSPESRLEYTRVIAEWEASGRQLPTTGGTAADLTVNELLLRYVQHAEAYYRRPDGTPTSEVDNIKQALRWVKRMYGHQRAVDFDSLALEAVRKQMIEDGRCRNLVNKDTSRIKRLFKWAASQKLTPLSTWQQLLTVEGLRAGRSTARDTPPVKPVPEAWVNATLPFVAPQVRAMIELQLFSGARPGEVCAMRTCDLDTSGRVWICRPGSHKTTHLGKRREIYLGPKAQEVLKPWVRLDTQAYLFQPTEAEDRRRGELRKHRRTPLWPSHVKAQARKRKRSPRRVPGDRYNVKAYHHAIQRACDRAFPLPEQLQPKLATSGKCESAKAWQARLTDAEKADVAAWRKAHRWHPHQLRHNAGTILRKQYGIELARIILGHSTAFTTEIYAEADRQQAIEVIAKIG